MILEVLEPEQQAVLELLLARERSYSFVAGALDLDEEDVAQTALDALRSLTPVTSARVGALDREAIGNLILGQATPAQAGEARGALKRPGAAREWAASLLDQLSDFAKPGTLPELPPLQRSRSGGGFRPSRTVIGCGAVGLVAVVVAAYLIGGGGGGGGTKTVTQSATAAPAGQAKVEKEGRFTGAKGSKVDGAAIVYDQGGAKTLAVQAQLPENGKNDAYEVWLYNSDTDLRAIGVRVTDSNGLLQGAAVIAKDYAKYGSVVLSREKVNTSPSKPTVIVARAPLSAAPASR